MELYPTLKAAHVAAVVASGLLFFVRGLWLLRAPWRLHRGWDRILPHTVDTLLLIFGVLLAWHTAQWPFVQPWLTAKLAGLVAYVGVGLYAFRGARTPAARGTAWLAAQGVFAYIVLVALSRDPFPLPWLLARAAAALPIH
ncbi:MAG TPA: regulator SirB [Chromatiales bacterium]|nr:regulator SirB [Chromatiales bacterium]